MNQENLNRFANAMSYATLGVFALFILANCFAAGVGWTEIVKWIAK